MLEAVTTRRRAARLPRGTRIPALRNTGSLRDRGRHPSARLDALGRARETAVTIMMAEAGRVFSASLDLDQTVHNIGHLVVGWFADWCVVDLFTRDGRFERVDVAAAEAGDAATAQALVQYHTDHARPSFVFDAMQARTPVLLPDVGDEHLAEVAQSSTYLEILRRLRVTSYLAVPLVSRGRLIGSLLILRKTGALAATELRIAEAIADLAAVAIDNARTYRDTAQALDARDDRLAIVAHDLRNPIAHMVFSAGLLELRLRETGLPGLLGIIRGIVRSAEYMTRLVNDLTDTTQLESGRYSLSLETVSAAALVRDAGEAFRVPARELGIRFQAAASDDLDAVLVDRARVFQVISNLVGNALKFTARDGDVRISAAPAGDHMHFTVRDTGRGIRPDLLPRIFEPFWRSDERPDRGLGLGLSIAKAIVELHGGRIWAESELGAGSAFHFTLPTAAGPP
jgi:signal transduction histidine kinase